MESERMEEQSPSARLSHKRKVVGAAGGGLLSVALCAGLFMVWGDSRPASAGAAPALPEVLVSQPLVQQLDTRLGFLGQFSAVDRVELRAQVGGTLTGIHFKDGELVQKGAPLFSVDRVPYEIRLAQAKSQVQRSSAQLAYAKNEFQRAEELVRHDAGSVQSLEQRKSEWQQADAAVAEANAQVRDAQFDLDHCEIVAPFSGRISNHLVSVGNLIAGSRAAGSPTTLLATLVSVDPIYLDFDMSESDYQQYKRYKSNRQGAPADSVQIAADGGHDYSTPGTLDFIDNALNRSSGTIHARAILKNGDRGLTPGEFARVRVITSASAPTLLLPDAVVLPDQSRFNVLTVDKDGRVAPKQVSVGDMRHGLRVITSGLSAQDRVIVGGLPFAAPGSLVNAKDTTLKADDDQAKE